MLLRGQSILELEPEGRRRRSLPGLQYPIEILGVNTFLKEAVNALRKARVKSRWMPYSSSDPAGKVSSAFPRFHERAVNAGFSGGEKKRNEILQMAMLEPALAVLDETDSGLDIDALKAVADGVNAMRSPDRSMLVITHYQRLLEYIVPDRVHVLSQGRIVRSGGPELAAELEEKGYADIVEAAA